MRTCKQWLIKNAYWGVSLLLFVGIAALFFGVGSSQEKTYQIVCLGDSIIGKERDETAVTAYMEQNLNVKVYNGALGGTTASMQNEANRAANAVDSNSLVELVDSICYENFMVQNASVRLSIVGRNAMEDYPECIKGLNSIDWSQVEILVIEHGVNDYLIGTTLDNPADPYDVNTYGGALRYSLKQLQTIRPDLRIILCTPTYCWFYAEELSCQEKDLGGGYLEDYVNLELEIAKEFGVEVIDNFHESGIGGEFENWSDYTEDGLHLNQAGRKLVAEQISKAILSGEQ